MIFNTMWMNMMSVQSLCHIFLGIFLQVGGDFCAGYPGNNGEKWAQQWHRTRAHFNKNTARARIISEQINFRLELSQVSGKILMPRT